MRNSSPTPIVTPPIPNQSSITQPAQNEQEYVDAPGDHTQETVPLDQENQSITRSSSLIGGRPQDPHSLLPGNTDDGILEVSRQETLVIPVRIPNPS